MNIEITEAEVMRLREVLKRMTDFGLYHPQVMPGDRERAVWARELLRLISDKMREQQKNQQ